MLPLVWLPITYLYIILRLSFAINRLYIPYISCYQVRILHWPCSSIIEFLWFIFRKHNYFIHNSRSKWPSSRWNPETLCSIMISFKELSSCQQFTIMGNTEKSLRTMELITWAKAYLVEHMNIFGQLTWIKSRKMVGIRLSSLKYWAAPLFWFRALEVVKHFCQYQKCVWTHGKLLGICTRICETILLEALLLVDGTPFCYAFHWLLLGINIKDIIKRTNTKVQKVQCLNHHFMISNPWPNNVLEVWILISSP